MLIQVNSVFGGMPWKTKWDQFMTLTLLKSHPSVFYCFSTTTSALVNF